jgi:acyl-CoA synthetase (AMP-forming)/AMP-acid ligase II
LEANLMYTFAQPLNRAFSTAAGSSAVVCQDRRRTYAELGSRCRRLAGAMRKLGLAPQDRVGVIALNSDRYLELYLGLPAAGYVLVPVNSRLAPAEMRAILDDAGVSLRYLSHGASPISVETLRRTRQAFPGAELLHVYGTTETTPIATLLPHEERILHTPLVRSCGQPAVGVEIQIVDSSQAYVPPGTVGEIAVRSPSVMAGYWCNPQATAEAMRGYWYLTGDLGYRDEGWYIYLVDRVKDMIVSGGENIYSTEVEDALATHAAVEEVAVFGVPDPRWGESVYAVVFCRMQVTPEELAAHCRERIAGYKVPRCIELRTEPLPKSAAGKILKRDLREPHWAGQQTQVSGG